MRFFSKICLCIAAGLQLPAMQFAQAQPTTFVCDPTIARNAAERHAKRIELAKQGGDAIDIPALEAAMTSRIDRLCKIDVETQEIKQATSEIKQATSEIKQSTSEKYKRIAEIEQSTSEDYKRIAEIEQSTREKYKRIAEIEQSTSEIKQSTANYKEMTEIINKINRQAHQPSDITRLTQLYKTFIRTANAKEIEQALPILASVLRKLGVAVD